MENNFNKTFWTNLSYVVLPLLPVAYTIFWQITSLHGTVVLLKMKKCLDRLVRTTSDKNDLNSNQKKYLLMRKKSTLNKFSVFKRGKSTTAKSSTLRVNVTKEGSLNPTAASAGPVTHHDRQNRDLTDQEILELSNIDNDENESDESEHMLVNNSRKFMGEDNISCINDLSSIDSLFDSLPFDDNTNSAKLSDNFIMKYAREAKFYFKIVRAIVLNNFGQTMFDDEDCRNANFIYFSNFLVGLGIITVNILLFKLLRYRFFFGQTIMLYFVEFLLHRQEGYFVVAESDGGEDMGI
jgi:hypothetical protein